MYEALHWALYHVWFQNKSELYSLLKSNKRKPVNNMLQIPVMMGVNNTGLQFA